MTRPSTPASAKIHRALISVSDKSGLAELARGLAAAGVEIYSTGGTRSFLVDAGLNVRDVADYTGFPEMMHGRVKTLHPKIFGGILCRRDVAEDIQALADHGIVSFELVVVNLYPFEKTVARGGASDAEIVEQIDIGGPSLVRAAAKNHAFVAIATDPAQYPDILAELSSDGRLSHDTRRRLAAEAFAHTAAYDAAIAGWFARATTSGGVPAGATDEAADFPPRISLSMRRIDVLRYGENPHQRAALYADEQSAGGGSLAAARQIHGKELSYNNLLDLDSALAIVRLIRDPSAVVIKHNNPCGAAAADELAIAARRALDGDPISAFGSVLGFNRPVDRTTAEVLVEPDRFIEAIIAPAFSPEAVAALTTRPKWKANVRLLESGDLGVPEPRWEYRQIHGGLLRQEADVLPESPADWKLAAGVAPSAALRADLEFGWSIVRHVKSNAIVLVRDRTLVGTGAGQMSRVDSVRLAIEKAGNRARCAALASDAFFPFADSIDLAAAAGVAGVVQPGGSRNDDEVTAACERHGLVLLLTGRRHFKH